MSSLRLVFLTVVASSIFALPVLAAGESSYVYCDNGLRCFKAPCPSNSALDLATGTIIKGGSIDASRLPQADKARADLSDLLFYGSIVVRGRIESRLDKATDGMPMRKVIVAKAIERQATMKERNHCSSRGLY
ncbi:hypothetical protein NKI77_32100 [Mesorhizobium opportunistum]|uniref:Uncharacterized protein n=1 Tax=Mesorhizobium opportunistum TaxID=593909 RepID=A0ABV1YQX7_9HYPH|nr:hypothetical protein [Mesorhizobium sp.]